jgi:hypothetical protein
MGIKFQAFLDLGNGWKFVVTITLQLSLSMAESPDGHYTGSSVRPRDTFVAKTKVHF